MRSFSLSIKRWLSWDAPAAMLLARTHSRGMQVGSVLSMPCDSQVPPSDNGLYVDPVYPADLLI